MVCDMNVLVTGGTGFFGHHVIDVLKSDYDVIGVGKSDYDLCKFDECNQMFVDHKPDVVIHMAAVTGGILKNKKYPADMWQRNMSINTEIFKVAIGHNLQKMIYILAGCAYPKTEDKLMSEDGLWDGYPDEHPAPFSLARKMGLVACTSYRKQYGLNSCVLIPGNMYGEHDCFDVDDCHVIPALMRKMHDSKSTGNAVKVWGTGRAIRDFAYARDVAECLPFFINNDHQGPINLSSGSGTSIKVLSEEMRKVISQDIEIMWDDSMPEGPSRKVFDTTKMKSLGLSCSTSLIAGLKKTYEWFVRNV